jgi:hypothetical protein
MLAGLASLGQDLLLERGQVIHYSSNDFGIIILYESIHLNQSLREVFD